MDKVGIVDWAIYLPKNVVTAKEIAEETIVHGIDERILIEKFGIIKKRVSDPDEHVSDMCIKAVKSLLDKTGLDPLEVDIIVYNGSQFTDYYVWPCAPTIQNAIGAENAYCYDLHALCVGGPLALYQLKCMLLYDKKWKNALIVSGTKESYLINYKDRATSFMWDFADGATAVWLKKGHDKNIILSGSFITDGYYNHVYNDSGSRGLLSGRSLEEMRYLKVDPEYHRIMKEEGRKGYRNFRELSKGNFVRVIKDAVEKSGYSLRDLKYVALLHLIPSFRRSILKEVGLSEENSGNLDEIGHLQSSDWIVSIDIGLKSGKIREGDLVVAVGAGTGFTWGATAIRWG